MSYELFRQSVDFAHSTTDDPLEEAFVALATSRKACGMVHLSDVGLGAEGYDFVPVKVECGYQKERDGPEEYFVKVHPEGGNVQTHYYGRRFDAEAVFEKMVRKWDLIEDPTQEDWETIREQYRAQFEGEDGGVNEESVETEEFEETSTDEVEDGDEDAGMFNFGR